MTFYQDAVTKIQEIAAELNKGLWRAIVGRRDPDPATLAEFKNRYHQADDAPWTEHKEEIC
jgi:hypothetical protein